MRNLSPLSKAEAAKALLLRRKAKSSILDFARSIDIPGKAQSEDLDSEVFLPVESTMALHHRLLLETLDRISKTPHGRLMVFMPPGAAKSTYASVVFPSYYLGKNPGKRIILASYGDDLAKKMGRRTRSIMRQRRYERIFNTGLAPDIQSVNNFMLTNESEYMACGILSGVTGNRADGIIIDDPIKGREQADSPIVREKTQAAFEDDLKTRLIPGGWICLIQTRWSEEDLAGMLLPPDWMGESGQILCRDGMIWEVLCIPARAERDDDPLGRKIGEYLWPEWFSQKHWAQFECNERTWWALYQQRPREPGGAFFKEEHFLIDNAPVEYPDKCDQIFAVIDTALKDTLEHDGTAVTYFARNKLFGIPLIVLDWEVLQIEADLLSVWLPNVLARCEELAAMCRARQGSLGAWIEDKASGIALNQHAAKKGWNAHPIPMTLTDMGKEGRAISVSGYVYQGQVKISRYAYDKTVNYKNSTKNHWLYQVCGFRLGQKSSRIPRDLLDSFSYGCAIALGNQEGY